MQFLKNIFRFLTGPLFKHFRVNLDGVFLDQKVHRATQESLVSQETRVAWVSQVFRGQKERQDPQDLRVLKVTMEAVKSQA